MPFLDSRIESNGWLRRRPVDSAVQSACNGKLRLEPTFAERTPMNGLHPNAGKLRLLAGLALLSSLFGYLEWGQGRSAYLFQAEWTVRSKLFTHPKEVVHPFTLLPLAGQVLLAAALFRKTPNRWLIYAGIGGIGLLLLLMLLAGVLARSPRIVLSTIPFVALAGATLRSARSSSVAHAGRLTAPRRAP